MHDARFKTRKSLRPALAALVTAGVLGFAPAASAGQIGDEFYTDIGSSAEAGVLDILAGTGYSLTRIPDNLDVLWHTMSVDAAVRVISRNSSMNDTFGVFGVNGNNVGEFHALTTAGGGTDWVDYDAEWVDLGSVFGPGESYLLGLQVGSRTFSSYEGLNPDGIDHMITYVDDEDPYHYFVAFEDAIGGGDLDFNDIVVELQLVLDDPFGVAEPGTLALLGGGLLGLGFLRRRRAS